MAWLRKPSARSRVKSPVKLFFVDPNQKGSLTQFIMMLEEEQMREWIGNPAFANNAKLVLIVAYVLLAVLFAFHKKTWPISLYYVGCFVKDTGVFALAFLVKRFH
jgi:hypothetical protein